MQEYAIYSVIPPEGCAAILWRDAGEEGRGGRGAEAHRARPAEGRHHRRDRARADRRRAHRSGGAPRALVDEALRARRSAEVSALDTRDRGSRARYDKFRNMGTARAIDFVDEAQA